MYYIYRNGKLVGGSSNSIDYVIEFTKLKVDKAIGGTEKDSSRLKQLYKDSSRLNQLYQDKLVLNSPNVWLHKLKPILERLGYELTIEVDDSTI